MSYTPELELALAETTITFANNNLHWCYVQVTIAESGNTATIVASESHIDPLQYWESLGQIYYKIGHFSPVVDGVREAHLIWGNMKPGGGIAYHPIQVTGLTLTAASWSLVSGTYEYDLANANILSTSIVDVIPDNAAIDTVKTAEIYPRTESSAGSVKLFSKNLPGANIGVTINIFSA